MSIDLDVPCTHEAFAELVGVSRPAVTQLIGEGTLARDASARVWLLTYCARLREQAAGRLGREGVDLATERAKLAKAHRERVERENAVARGDLLPVELLAQQLAHVGARCSAILDAIPARVRTAAPQVPASVLDVVQQQVTLARNECAALELPDHLLPEDDDADE